MPTPIGHSLAGLAVAWSVGGLRTGPALQRSQSRAGAIVQSFHDRGVRLAAVCVLLAVAPDADILLAVHRAAWHSATAAVIVGLAVWLWGRARGHGDAGRAAVACGLAWASHVGLDWLGRDSSPPQGVMALWPASSAYFESGLDVFAEVSRRYWRPDEFVWGNLRSLTRELALLLPVVALAWRWRRSYE